MTATTPRDACRTKRPYKTQQEAEAAILKKRSQPDYYIKDGYILHWYLCSQCYCFHIENTRIWQKEKPE